MSAEATNRYEILSFSREKSENYFNSLLRNMVSSEYIDGVGLILKNTDRPLKLRFRALFTLKNIGGCSAIDQIIGTFCDKSALLKHELAYCLGQMKNPYAIPALKSLLEDTSQEVVVRHEAAEALGAIGDLSCLDVLNKYRNDSISELSETCELAIYRLTYLANGGKEHTNVYNTVDPVPPSKETNIDVLKNVYLDDNKSIIDRYQAMFALRDLNSNESIDILNEGLSCGSVLFRHEVAFVLGQVQSPLSIPSLVNVVENDQENDIVRHESIEALGSIGTPACMEVIKKFINDQHALVRESCEVALDMYDYENSSEFQYANGLEMVA